MRFKSYLNERDENILDLLKRDCKPFFKEIGKNSDLLYRGSHKKFDDLIKIKPRKDREPSDMRLDNHKTFDNFFNKKFGWKPRSEGVFTVGRKRTAANYGNQVGLFFPIGQYKYVWSQNIEDLFSDTEDVIQLYDFDYAVEIFDDEILGEYEEKYGENCINGLWEYEGVKLISNDEVSAKKEFFNIFVKKNNVEEEDFDELYADIEWKMEWVPDMTEKEWIIKRKKEWKNERDNCYKEIVNKYTDKNLKQAIDYRNEIMFKCKEYYLVNLKYFKDIHESMAGGFFT